MSRLGSSKKHVVTPTHLDTLGLEMVRRYSSPQPFSIKRLPAPALSDLRKRWIALRETCSQPESESILAHTKSTRTIKEAQDSMTASPSTSTRKWLSCRLPVSTMGRSDVVSFFGRLFRREKTAMPDLGC